MKRYAVVLAVALLGLLAGAAVAGLPASVENDVVSGELQTSASQTDSSTSAPSSTAVPSTVPSATVPSSVVTSASSPTDSSTPPTSTPPTSAALAAEGTLRVVVGNATNTTGLATATADRLAILGYGEVIATEALATRATTIILFVEGRSGEALRMAAQLGLDIDQVAVRPPGGVTVDSSDADLWILVGADQL